MAATSAVKEGESMKRPVPLIALCLVSLVACTVSTPALPATTPPPTPSPLPAATPTPAPTISPEASAYLDAAIAIMEANSINRLKLDWAAIRAEAFHQARYAQTPADTYGVLRALLRQAGGKHSLFMPPAAAGEQQQSTLGDSPPPRGKLLPQHIGFVALEGFSSTTEADGRFYATFVQQLIREVDAQGACGWIVDLRENSGGNMWPMLAGLGPLLGEGVAGAFVDPEGQSEPWSYMAGQARLGEQAITQVEGPAYELQSGGPPVAVLTGINTASSGEAIAIAFRGRPQTRSFGHYTNGLTTANAGYPLSDGALLVLTTSVMADRTGHVYGEQIIPDEKVDDVRLFTSLMDEAIPQPAVDWLLAQPPCAAEA